MAYGRGFEGSRLAATKEMSRAEIAKLYRLDIKVAIARGDLPKGLKTSVRTREYSMGGSIDTVVTAAPGMKFLNPTRVYADLAGPYGSGDAFQYLSPEAQALLNKLDALLQAYNYDDSNSAADYFHVRFAGDARFEQDLLSAEREAYKAAFAAGTFKCPPLLDYLDHVAQTEKLSKLSPDPEGDERAAALAAAQMLGANLMRTHKLYDEMTEEEKAKVDAEEDAKERRKAAYMDNEGAPELLPEEEYEQQLAAAGWV